MSTRNEIGKVIILNGVPRSGKSSIATIIQESFEGIWMNLGVDSFMKMTPERYQPGLGLRPGGERPDLGPAIVQMYEALYESIAAHSRLGINVVVDIGHHDWYSVPRNILSNCAELLKDSPVLFVGIKCPVDEIMKRRIATWKIGYDQDGSIPIPVKRWQEAVHNPGIYDLELDTSEYTSKECAHFILDYLESGKPLRAFEMIGEL